MDIYIGNLPYESDEQSVRDAFAEHGNIDNVKIVIDQYTGRSKGFGFVTMSDWKEAQAAISALDGTSMGGRTIKVNQARQREQKPFRGGGDRGGDRGDFRRKRY